MKVSHRLEAGLVVAIGALVRILPERVAQGMGAGLGWFVGAILRLRRRTVEENLRIAFPEWSEDERRTVALDAYRHLGREGIALLRLGALSADELRARTEIDGWEHVEAAMEGGRGAILLTGHLGNWEVGGAAIALRGVPLDVVGKAQSNPLFDRRIRTMREGFGMRPIYRHEATRPLLKGLREGRAAALVADQNVRSGGVFIPFFGKEAATARGPGVLSTRTGAPPIFVAVHRLPGSRARYQLTIRPIEAEGEVAILEGYHSLLEAAIREAPDQYFWFHRRWKTRP